MEIKKHYAYFSAAMRAGIELYGPIHGPYVSRDENLRVCGTCAMGAGLVAAGLNESHFAAFRAYPYLGGDGICPVDDCTSVGSLGTYSLFDVGIILYETHRWSREQVADWLYEEEEKLGFVTLVETEASPELSLEIQHEERAFAVSPK